MATAAVTGVRGARWVAEQAETEEVDTTEVECRIGDDRRCNMTHSLAVASEAFAFHALYALLTVMAATVAMAVRIKNCGPGRGFCSHVHLRIGPIPAVAAKGGSGTPVPTGRTSSPAGWGVALLYLDVRGDTRVLPPPSSSTRACSYAPAPLGLPGACKPDIPHYDLQPSKT